MNDSLRLECLRLAVQAHGDVDPAYVVKAARAYADFVDGTRDAEIIAGVRELAEKIAAS